MKIKSYLMVAIAAFLITPNVNAVEPNGGMKTHLEVYIKAPVSYEMLTREQVRNLKKKYPGEATACIQRIQGLLDSLGSEYGSSEIGFFTGSVTLNLDHPDDLSIRSINYQIDIRRNGQGTINGSSTSLNCEEFTRDFYRTMEFAKKVYKEKYAGIEAKQKVFDDFMSTLNSSEESLGGPVGRAAGANATTVRSKVRNSASVPEAKHEEHGVERARDAE